MRVYVCLCMREGGWVVQMLFRVYVNFLILVRFLFKALQLCILTFNFCLIMFFFFQCMLLTTESLYLTFYRCLLWHLNFQFQLLLDVLSFSASSFSILARYPVSTSKESMVIAEKFVLELLNLTEDSISEIKVLITKCMYLFLYHDTQFVPGIMILFHRLNFVSYEINLIWRSQIL